MSTLKFVQAKSYYRAGNSPALIVIHDMEYPERSTGAEWCADFFASTAGASAHYCVDSDSIVQCVHDADGAWHTPGSLPSKGGTEINRMSIGIEHAGYAKQTATEWDDDYSRAMLELSASLVAKLCVKHAIPPRRLSPTDLKEPGVRGICGHVDATKATGVGSHWDPGPNFPWDWYMARVAAHFELQVAPASVLVTQPGGELFESAWPIVQLDGVAWSVAPTYITPIGIGAARDMARDLGCELPSPALVDAIWAQADLKLTPFQRSPEAGTLKDWGASMSSVETFNDQMARLEAAIAGRSFTLLAGVCKDVVAEGAVLGIYGGHRPDGSILQPFYDRHALGWIDYLQGLRLCRRT